MLRRLTNFRFTAVFLFILVSGVIGWKYESAAVGVMVAAAGVVSVFVGAGEAKDAYAGKIADVEPK